MENILEIKNLRKHYKDFTLNDVSFNLPKGYIMGLIGPNGAGKTTVIKLIMNLIMRDGGEISLFGKDSITNEVEVKSHIGFVYDVPCFYEDISLKTIKSAIAPFYKKWDENCFMRLIEEFELPLKKKFKKLSQGMKTKFALALALSHDADLIIMDEPTSGLDPVFRRDFLEKLSELIQDGEKSVLFSTHITSDLERIADYITFINKGEVVFSNTKDEIMENWGVVRGGEELLKSEMKGFFKGFRKSDFSVEGLTDNISALRKMTGEETVVEKATLEDIMFFISRGSVNA